MKNILDLASNELIEYFFKSNSYINFDIPIYFDFSNLLKTLNDSMWDARLKSFNSSTTKTRDCENVNYSFMSNKSWKYDWRPFEIIHPLLYIELVNLLAKNTNWEFIKGRFTEFQENWAVNCLSLPIISENDNSNKAEQVINWWEKIEQESIILGLDYSYLFHTDITDCYSSIYTHSVAWALHWKDNIKRCLNDKSCKLEKLLWGKIDGLLQDMSFRQTNWIPQWSNIMDFLAEIVLWYSDLLLAKKLADYWIDTESFKILRYRDDYRIFTNNPVIWENILKSITEVLSSLWLKLSKWKTKYSNDVIKSSVKEDKYDLIINSNYNTNLLKELLTIKHFSDKNPNSWSLVRILQEFNNNISEEKFAKSNVDYQVFISIIVNIMFNNPNVFPIATAILSKIIKMNNGWVSIISKILKKFSNIPNTWHLEIWLQRITLKLDSEYNSYGSEICKKVNNNDIELWNSKWLWSRKLKKY